MYGVTSMLLLGVQRPPVAWVCMAVSPTTHFMQCTCSNAAALTVLILCFFSHSKRWLYQTHTLLSVLASEFVGDLGKNGINGWNIILKQCYYLIPWLYTHFISFCSFLVVSLFVRHVVSLSFLPPTYALWPTDPVAIWPFCHLGSILSLIHNKLAWHFNVCNYVLFFLSTHQTACCLFSLWVT